MAEPAADVRASDVSNQPARSRCAPAGCGGCSAGRLDQVHAAPFRQSLELAQTAINEADRRARQELPGRPRGIDLAGLRQVYDPRRNVNRRAADGTVWMGGNKGVARYRPSQHTPRSPVVTAQTEREYTDVASLATINTGQRVTFKFDVVDF